MLLVQLHERLRVGNGGFTRRRLEHRVPADDFLGLGEWAVGHGQFLAGDAETDALGAAGQPAGLHQRAVLERRLDQLAHRGDQSLRRRHAELGALDNRQESHRFLSLV